MKDVSIIVLAWNNVTDVTNCITSIIQGTDISYQLIVVDNGSQDDTPRYLSELQKEWNRDDELLVITNQKNLGYAAGNNVALEYITGRYTLFLNQDIVIEPTSIDQLVAWMKEHPEYGAIAPQLQYPDGTIQLSCRQLPTPIKMLQNYLKGSWNDEKLFDHSQSQDCEQPMASAIMLPSDDIKQLGGFDDHPDYWLFFNDVDLSKQVFESGKKTYFLAESKMMHHHGASTRKLVKIKKLKYWHRGMIRYFSKWYCQAWWQKVLLYLGAGLSFVGLFIRDLLRGLKSST